MVYTPPTTRSTADLITASIWNADLVENIKFLANPPACRVYHNAAQSVAHASLVTLAFNSERYDTAAMHDTATNNSRITVPAAGLYIVTAHIDVASNAAGTRNLTIEHSVGAAVALLSIGANGSDNTRMSLATVYKAAAGTYFTLTLYQTSGGALNVSGTDPFAATFSATWVGLG